MDTAQTAQDSAAEVANLFSILDAPKLRVISGGKDSTPMVEALAVPAVEATAAAVPGLIRFEELRTRDRVQFGHSYPGQVEPGFKAEIIPAVSVRIFGTDYNGPFNLTFKIGDSAVYDSYNRVYTAQISKIGPKTVTVGGCRLDICTFAQKNHNYDAQRIFKRNSEWSD